MRDQPDQAAVAGDEGRRQEGERRILHAPVGEARRQHDHVVAAPAIGPVEPLRRLHHPLGVLKLRRRPLDHRRLGPHPGPPPELPEFEVAGRDRDQIGRDRMGHAEAIGAPSLAGRLALGRQALARHHHLQGLRRGDPGLPGLADARAVLARDPAPVEDRLALAEQIGMALAGGLVRAQPLQRLGIGRAPVADFELPRSRPDADGQRLAPRLVAGAERMLKRRARAVGDRLDLQPLAVEHDLSRALGRLDVENRRPRHPFRLEVRVEVERDMGHPRHLRPGEAAGVARILAGQHRRHLARPRGRLLVPPAFRHRAGVEDHRGGEGKQAHMATPARNVRAA